MWMRKLPSDFLGALTYVNVVYITVLLFFPRFVSVLIGLPLLVYSRLEKKQYIEFVEYWMCLEVWPSDTARTVYAAIIMLLQFVIPVVVLIIIHWRICNFLKTRILQVIIYIIIMPCPHAMLCWNDCCVRVFRYIYRIFGKGKIPCFETKSENEVRP